MNTQSTFRFMLDTNAYDYLLDNKIDLDTVKAKGTFYITNVQTSELMNTPYEERRRILISIVEYLAPTKLNLQSGIWIDELQWDDDQPWLDDIGETAKTLVGKSKTSLPWQDALMGEVAKIHNLTIVTNDISFRNKLIKEGIPTVAANYF